MLKMKINTIFNDNLVVVNHHILVYNLCYFINKKQIPKNYQLRHLFYVTLKMKKF